MSLLDKINECSYEEIDALIKNEIEEKNKNAIKVDRLGFLDTNIMSEAHRGFIPLDTRIRYAAYVMEDYSMATTDFIYGFAHFLKDNEIKSNNGLINSLEYYLNDYFGISRDSTARERIFAFEASKKQDDKEYFEAIKNNKIGDLKGKDAAECTERAAVVQQILSIFDMETYYCMGCIVSRGKCIPHSFNVVKSQSGYAVLDYSMPITAYNPDWSVKAFCPFAGILKDDEYQDFLYSGSEIKFSDYYIANREKQESSDIRTYAVGKYKIKQNTI